MRNPVPQNPSFPYYVCGLQNDAAGGAQQDDVILLNLNEAGTFNWKKKYSAGFSGATVDDEYARDMEALSNGDLILAGNGGTTGIMLRLNNTGSLVTAGTPFNLPISYTDISRNSSNGFYAVGGTSPSFTAWLIKYDNNLIAQWHVAISGLTAISQVWEDPATAKIYVTGTEVINSKSRSVLIRLTGQTSPSIDLVKYLDNNETSYQGGSFWHMSPGQIAFVDGRFPSSGGFGGEGALMSLSDLDLTTCLTKQTTLSLKGQSFDYNGPQITASFLDVPKGKDIVIFSNVDWKDQSVCKIPCKAAFTFQSLTGCGSVIFANQSTGATGLTYLWNFSDPGSGVNNTASAPAPVHQFSACGSFRVCLTITAANGCTDSICQTVTYLDEIKPVITCPKDLTVSCNGSINPTNTGFATATDNCDYLSNRNIVR
ncbi:MAG: PKD domain-containing protein [Saprospiraceae bacterium]|nr:PKD domain-containing protein [Saprospiraceae bacterium]